MARTSKGKFRNLRDHFTAQKYFNITKKNIEQMKLMLGDDSQVGEHYIMRPMTMTPELREALTGKPNLENVGRPLRNIADGVRVLEAPKKRPCGRVF